MLSRHRSLTKGFGFTFAKNLVDRFGVFKGNQLFIKANLGNDVKKVFK